MCVCVCVVIPFILDVRIVDAPVGVTQEGGHTGFSHLPSGVLALIFLARRIQPFLSLVDREAEFCVLTNLSFSTYFLGAFCCCCCCDRKNPSSCDSTKIRTHVPTSEGFEVTNRTTGATCKIVFLS